MKVLVVDNSQYVEFARVLGKSGLFENVGYFAPWQEDTPVAQEMAVGSGWPEFTREYDLFEALDNYDALCFPAMYHDGMQRWARRRGMPVWGSGDAEHLERDRWKLLETMASLGMNTSPSQLLTLDEARKQVSNGDVLKFSTFRGDVETTVHKGDFTWYHETALRWGPLAGKLKVVLQKPLPKGAEPGYDTIIVRGQVVGPISVGYEVKDGGYIECNMPLRDLPPQFVDIHKGVMQMLGPEYTNFMSTEVMSETLLDITCRIPEPPGNLKFYIWQGIPEIVLRHLSGGYGSAPYRNGTDPRAKWGVQLIAHNNNPKNYCKWGAIDASIAEQVFFNRAFVLDGCVWTAPWKDRSVQDWVDAASVCGCGDTPEEAIDEAQRVADELKLPAGCLIDAGTTDSLMEALEEGEKEGIPLL